MRAFTLGAVMALTLTGCSFVVNGVQSDASSGDNIDLSMDAPDLAMSSGSGDDLAMAGDMAQPPPPPDMAVPPDMAQPPPTGSLVGSIAITSGSPINLTTEGTADWAHWGAANKNSFDHKSIPTPLISDFTPTVNNETITQLGSYALGFSWSDGTPTPSATNSTTGIYVNGQNSGFRISVPADTTTRTLRFYAGGQMSTATVLAHLSDGSAADYTTTATTTAGDTGMQFERVVTLVYRAAAAGQTLTVSWTVSSATGYVHLHSATLQ